MLPTSQTRSTGERSNRRLPGQYFDAETGTHYNYFRDYDLTVDRYAESDPLGLAGGLNTYAYAKLTPDNSPKLISRKPARASY